MEGEGRQAGSRGGAHSCWQGWKTGGHMHVPWYRVAPPVRELGVLNLCSDVTMVVVVTGNDVKLKVWTYVVVMNKVEHIKHLHHQRV